MLKYLISTMILFVMIESLHSQNSFKSVQDGDWNDASTWISGGGAGGTEGIDYPSDSDIVIVDHYVIINTANSGSNFVFTGDLTINQDDTLECQVGGATTGFILEGNGVMRNYGSFFTLDATEDPDENAHIPKEFICRGNSVFIGGLNSFAFISDDWELNENAQVFIDNLLCYAVSDDVNFESTGSNMYGTGNIRIGGDGANSTVNFNGGSTVAQLDDDITIWRNVSALACTGTSVSTGSNPDPLPPFAFDDTYRAALNTVQNQNVLYQGSVDFSPTTGDTLTISSVGSDALASNGSTSNGGSVSVNNNGTPSDPTDDYVLYTPPTDFIGIDTYNYLITNEAGETDIAMVTVTITACAAGFVADTTLVTVSAQSDNIGVGSPANVIGSPDGSFAEWHAGGNILHLDFGQSFTAGTQYKITWRVRPTVTGDAQAVIRESTTNGSFTALVAAYTIIDDETTKESIITSENDFRFLQIEKDNGVNANDFEIDAIEVLDINCLIDTDNDGIANLTDIDDDNDGIKDADEAQCVTTEAFWNMDNTTDDATVNNHDERTDGNTPSFSLDAIQGSHSASFNGTTNRIRYSQDGGFMELANSTISFSAWIKPSNLSGVRVIYEEGGGTNGFTVYLNAGVPTVSTRAAAVQFDVTIATTLSVDNQWHHIGGTFDNGDLTVFFDGVSNTTTASYTIIPDHTSDGGVGCFFDDNPIGATNSTGHYAGLIDGAKYSDSEVWTASEIDFSCDQDGDGIANYLDLDSDNDGISDIVEAKGVDIDGNGKIDGVFVDTDGDGLHNTYDTDNSGDQISNTDTDGDGISDAYDSDSDNDGIPDVIEVGGTDTNGDGKADNYADTDNDGFNDIVDADVGNDNNSENTSNSSLLTGVDTNGDGIPNSYPSDDQDGDGILNHLDLDADNDGIADVVEAGGTDVNGDGRADDYVDADNDGFNDVVDGDPTNALVAGSDASGANTTDALILSGSDTNNDGSPNSFPNGDFDQDNIYNFLDLDADDDGILDNTEVGGTDANRDGQEDSFTDADNDGFNDNVDGDPDNSLAVGSDATDSNLAGVLTATGDDTDADGVPNSYPNDDFDSDNLYNFLDIDADNDGITDNTEGQGTATYIAPANADNDGDGIDNAYDSDDANFGGASSSFVLSDIDNASDPNSPDYLDLDSDADNDNDALEGHDSDNDGTADSGSAANTGLAGGTTDADGDGLLDGYDNNTSSPDPTNGSLQGSSFPNQDITSTVERDWREALDNDEDGIPDTIDLDDDNDGIPDTEEGICNVGDAFTTAAGAYWSLDGNTNDISGNGRNQQAGSGPSFSLDAIQGSNSGSFNGSTDFVQYSDGSFMNSAYTTVSFSAWIKPDNLSGNRIVYEEGGSTNGAVLWLNAGVLTFSTRENSNQTNVTHPTTLTVDNEWHHVAGVYDGGLLSVYLDGVPNSASTSPASTTIPAHGDAGGIGAMSGGSTAGGITGAFFSGLIDVARYSNTTAWSAADIAAEINISCDQDGDGIDNQFDLDSDNDGIPDIVEAGGEDTNGDGLVDDITGTVLNNDSDGDGLDDRYDSNNGGNAITNGDTDGDGILNTDDLDSDNDGIPDVVEAGGTDENGDGRADDYVDADNDGFNDIVDGDVGNDGTAENSADALTLTGDDSNNNGIPNSYPNDDNDGDGILNQFDLDSDNDGIPDVVEVGGTDENGDGRADDYLDADRDGFNDIVDGDPDNSLALGSDANDSNTSNALLTTGEDSDGDGTPNSRPNDDFDGDNIYNFLDLDSDDDGILDVAEAGGTDANRDGQQDGSTDADNDGYNDSVDGDTDNSLAVGSDADGGEQANALTLTDADADLNGAPDDYPNDDFDNDGLLNFLDIDADNDGITDNTEGQPTTVAGGYVAPANADDDGDGIDNAYDSDDSNFGGASSSFVLNDADASANPNTPDYLDIDADNDGDLDSLEGHDTDNDRIADGSSPANTGLSGGTTDADNDGLLDGFDNNTSSSDPTNGSLLGDSHPNEDNSATTEHDWREALDTDRDGIPDLTDIDDDNDGILDVDEGNCSENFVTSVDAFWSLDGNTNDISGNSRNQQAGSGPSYSTDVIQGSNSGSFNGSSDFVQYSDGSFMNSSYSTVSFSAWIKPDNLSGNRIVYEEGGSTNGAVLWLNAGVLTFSTRENTNQTNVTHPTTLTVDNEWHHVAAVYNSGLLSVYLDGIPNSANTSPASTTIPGHGDPGGIGAMVGGSTAGGISGAFFSGLIDAARYSNSVAWTDTEIANEARTDCDDDGDGIDNQFDLDSDNDGIPDIIEAGGVDADNDGMVDGVFTDTDGDGWSNTFDSDDGGTALSDGDQDGDGIKNRLDLDADDDGIADIIEAGGTDADGNGRADVTTDGDRDGWSNTFDNDNGGTALTILDTDGDALSNYLDIDSDSDGITDNVEGQSTLAFVAPLGTDLDNDGWDDRYDGDVSGGANGTPISLSNNDGSGNPDYIDVDSDGDGQLDWIEGFDDNEDDEAGPDIKARAAAYETAAGDPGHYLNVDLDLNGEVDYLDDADMDGVPNFLDPQSSFYQDSDGDGLINLYDTDNSGVASITPDGNSDGEFDFRDIDNQITLPIELISFEARLVGEKIELKWTTATEINNAYFIVERSIDGKTFEQVLKKTGNGNSTTTINYIDFDYSYKSGYNYYRLTQVDFDGKSETFDQMIRLVKVWDRNKETVTLYPNPTNGENLWIEIRKPQSVNYTLEILSTKGELLKSQKIKIESEQNSIRNEVLNGLILPKGIYYLKLSGGEAINTFKFIVQ